YLTIVELFGPGKVCYTNYNLPEKILIASGNSASWHSFNPKNAFRGARMNYLAVRVYGLHRVGGGVVPSVLRYRNGCNWVRWNYPYFATVCAEISFGIGRKSH